MKLRIQRLLAGVKPYQGFFERFVFPVVLFLYPFIGALQGVDVTDTTYSLGNYAFTASADPMWVIATYLPHMTGRLFMRLPFGNTMAGMNVYCTLFISLTALFSYFLLWRFLPGWMIFAGEWIAESLCWCPRVILYNYMTYCFFTLGTLVLVHALTDDVQGRWKYVLAGILLGMNVTVRLPNVVEAVLIVTVFVYGRMMKRSAFRVFKQVMLCVGGYFAGFLVPFLAICVSFGSYAYAGMISDLFSMSETASEYSPAVMVLTTIRAYGRTIRHMAIIVPCMAAGVAMFTVFRERYVTVKKLLYVAGLLILARYYFARGVFTFNYWYYDSMFQPAMMFIMVSILLFAADLAGFCGGRRHERLLSLTALLVIPVLPIGSNNYTYPVLNCMFFIAPVSLCVFRRAVRRTREGGYALQHFVWISAAAGIVLVLLAQGTLFHARFAFRDGMTDGTPRTARITEIPRLRYMATGAENAERLTDMYRFLKDGALLGEEVILFGDIPGIAYIMEMKPAIFSTWPDLESNRTERFDEALNALTTPPLVIVHEGAEYPHTERKYNLLLMYMDRNGYRQVYDDGAYRIYRHTDDETEGISLDGTKEDNGNDAE